MSQDEAMGQYIAIIDSLAKQHGADSPQAAAATPTSATEDLLVSVSYVPYPIIQLSLSPVCYDNQATDETLVPVRNRESGLLTIQLNRPTRHNALNRAMYAGIVSALESAAAQDRVKAVLIQATGAMFSSGNDLSMFTEQPEGVSFEAMADAGAALLTGFVDALVTFPKPVVAAVQGPAVGIAVTMLALCDLVYVSETVTLQTPFTALGQTPEACSSVLFPRIMGPARANALLLLGEKLTAQDAVACGLATSVLSVGDFDQRVQEKVEYVRMWGGDWLARQAYAVVANGSVVSFSVVHTHAQSLAHALPDRNGAVQGADPDARARPRAPDSEPTRSRDAQEDVARPRVHGRGPQVPSPQEVT